MYICKKQGDKEIHVFNLYHWGPGYHQPYLVVVAPNAVSCCSNRWWPQRLAPFFWNGLVEANIFPNGSRKTMMRAQCVEHIIHISEPKILPLNHESIFWNWDILNEFSHQPDLFYCLQMVGTPTIGPRWLPKHLTTRSNFYWALAPIWYLLRREYRQISPQWHPTKRAAQCGKCEGLTHEIPTTLQTVELHMSHFW